MRVRDLAPRQRLDGETVTAAAAAADDSGFVALARAIAGWRRALGDAAVIIDDARHRYAANCIGIARSVPVVLRPRDEAGVRRAMAVASDCGVPLHPVSTGNNWGYGSAVPPAPRSVVMDLSAMRDIVWLDRELGLVCVQPGVTQGLLSAHLLADSLPFMVPVTGAGPNCSLIGNALERGYGITPHADHFAAVRALRAVLPDGRLYRSALAEAGGALVDAAYKWGTGPYLDGLYSQGGFGIVTQMTLALARRPQRIEAFAIELDDEPGAAVTALSGLLQSAGGGIGGVNLMNRLRLLAMTHPYPHHAARPGQALPPELVERLGRDARLPRWLMVGALYGDAAVVAGLRRALRRRMAPLGGRLRFIDRRKMALGASLAGLLPGAMGQRLARRVATADEALDMLSGVPRETALRLAYWRSGVQPPPGAALDPARDGCGVIWFSPLVPMKAAAAETLIALVEDICPRFGLDPLITFSSVSEQCFDCTVPLLYDAAIGPEATHACYDSLAEACAVHGFLPYRMNLRAMRAVADDPSSTYWRLVGDLKRAVDPRGLISPGRYAPLADEKSALAGMNV